MKSNVIGVRIVLAVIIGWGIVAWSHSGLTRELYASGEGEAPRALPSPVIKTATFAGGCFWCMEEAFDGQAGVVSVRVGYTGGHVKNPTYDEVSEGRTGHAEAIQIRYDPQKISYGALLAIFWRNIDPIAKDRQFCDYGDQYRSAIFYHDEEQQRLAEAWKAELNPKFDGLVATQIVAASLFYPAEAYHQDYYTKNPARYKLYKWSCGRAQRLKAIWGDPGK